MSVNWAWAFDVACWGCVASVWLKSRSRNRIIQLEAAAQLLRVHRESTAFVLNDPDAPLWLQRVLMTLSDQGRSEESAGAFVKHLLASVHVEQKNFWLLEALDKLQTQRPDLVAAFEKAITSGTSATVLRYRSTAKLFNKVAVALSADPRSELWAVADPAEAPRQAGTRMAVAPA